MPPDRTAHLIIAAKQRHELTRAKAIRAIRELDRAGTAVTFGAIAKAAQVSRSWLYTQHDIREEIRKLRASAPPPSKPTAAVPTTQRASAESLRQRMIVMQERIHHLVEENQRLRNQLAIAIGEQRIGASATALRPDHSSVTIKQP